MKPQEKVSTTDPDATWAIKSGPAVLGYYGNYLIDTTSRVILAVHATPALFSQETLAARRMLEHIGQFGIHPQNWQPIKPMGVESSYLGSWHATFSRTFQSSIVGTKQEDCLPEMRSATNPRKMPTTVQKENRCITEVSGVAVGAIFIARQKLNAETVRKRSYYSEH